LRRGLLAVKGRFALCAQQAQGWVHLETQHLPEMPAAKRLSTVFPAILGRLLGRLCRRPQRPLCRARSNPSNCARYDCYNNVASRWIASVSAGKSRSLGSGRWVFVFIAPMGTS